MSAVRTRKALSIAGAEAVMSAAQAEAMKHDYRVVIAIVDPWGHVVARASDGPGLALAEIDLDRVARVRRAIPVSAHFRPTL